MIVAVPDDFITNVFPDTSTTVVLLDVYVTGNPELALAVKGISPFSTNGLDSKAPNAESLDFA